MKTLDILIDVYAEMAVHWPLMVMVAYLVGRYRIGSTRKRNGKDA